METIHPSAPFIGRFVHDNAPFSEHFKTPTQGPLSAKHTEVWEGKAAKKGGILVFEKQALDVQGAAWFIRAMPTRRVIYCAPPRAVAIGIIAASE